MHTIREIQGEHLLSPFAGQTVTVSGVVTGVLRRGFFLQTAGVKWDGKASNAVFVYCREWSAVRGSELEVTGECVDFIKHESAKPVTQIHFESVRVKSTDGVKIQPVRLNQEMLGLENQQIATLLNSLEGMLVSVAPGQTFIAPSNRYGDYVLALDSEQPDTSVLRSKHGGAIASIANPLRWFPGFRISNYNHAHRLNVGAKLRSEIQGPLNYRVDSYQIALNDPFKVEPAFVELTKSSIEVEAGSISIMTLNCFNLDPHVELAEHVSNPRQDIDDDWGEGRFHTLAQAIVLQANCPDVVALQEIQDNDGAEISEVVDASTTYSLLAKTVEELSGIAYEWVDVAPEVDADGGQPGGNIRNGYLYNPARISLDKASVRVFGSKQECFAGSRKPIVCEFIETKSQSRLAIINVHLASKRHQESIFAPANAGIDNKLAVRVDQARSIRAEVERLDADGTDYYVTGDFNDTEHSETLQELLGEGSANLVMSLPAEGRYDYNHRGKLQVLMHGVVSKKMVAEQRTLYEIIHGNELIGITPGEQSNKPSDHAYVIARLKLSV